MSNITEEKVAKITWIDTPGNRQFYVVGEPEITSNKESEFRKLVKLAGYTHYISCGRKYKVKAKGV